MKQMIRAVGFTLLGMVLVANVFSFAMIFVDYGWRDIPIFLSYGVLAWITFIRGILASVAFLLIVVDWFLEEKIDAAG